MDSARALVSSVEVRPTSVLAISVARALVTGPERHDLGRDVAGAPAAHERLACQPVNPLAGLAGQAGDQVHLVVQPLAVDRPQRRLLNLPLDRGAPSCGP